MKNKVGNDQYMDRGMNTFNEPPKFKVIQTTKITYSVCSSLYIVSQKLNICSEYTAKQITVKVFLFVDTNFRGFYKMH
jgi:hypothetical protein